MLTVRIRRLLGTLAAAALAIAGVQLASAATAQAEPAPTMATVYYTAAGYQSESDQAAAIWNDAVPNLDMQPSSNGSIVIYATTGGGSRAYPCGLGCATIYIDSQDIAAGHNALRIVSHEIGHGHQLPDNYNGDCNLLMSGGSAGTSCTNPYPSSGEASTVNGYYGGAWSAADAAPVESGSVYDPSLVTVTR